MYPKLTGKLRHRTLALQGFQGNFRLKLWAMVLSFRHSDPLLVEDQQTTNISLSQCPNFGG